jgi:hypothetical protein
LVDAHGNDGVAMLPPSPATGKDGGNGLKHTGRCHFRQWENIQAENDQGISKMKLLWKY